MATTVEDITIALGEDVPAVGSATYAQWQMWIADARMLIQARLGDLDALDQEILDYVVREAVVAQIRRPDDATTVSVSVDDGSVSKQYRTSRGRVTILDEWWTLLSPEQETGGAFAIDTMTTTLTTHRPWCALAFDALYCSCGGDLAGFPLFEA